MQRIAWIALLSVVMLSGCGKTGFQPEQIRQLYQENRVDATMTVTTHNGYYCAYTLEYSENADGAEITVTAPESVAGISAHLREDGWEILFDEIQLDALTPNTAGMSPADALFGILYDVRRHLPDNYSMEAVGEEPGIVAEYGETLPDGTDILKRVVLDGETLAIRQGELYQDGALILTVEIKDFSLRQKEPVASEGEL